MGRVDIMLESSLYEILINRSELIEEGLVYIESQVRIGTYRCDLLFLDRNGKKLFVEVKLKVDDKAVGQLLRYDGLVNNAEHRFMLVGLSFVHGLKEALNKHGYEHRELILPEHTLSVRTSSASSMLTKGEAKYKTPQELISSFENEQVRNIAGDLFNFVGSLFDAYYYLSDGIMFKRSCRNYKFLSITTIGERLLFHFPMTRRDEIFSNYSSKVNIYIPRDPRDKNQIDIKLKDVKHLDEIKEIIHLAYELRE